MRHLLSTVQSALADRYLVKHEVGRGSMAVVFFAWDHERQREVAIKVLRPEFSTPIISERFHREIAFLSTLDHPNILSILDSGGSQGLTYFTMPFAHGDTLATRIDKEGALPLDEALHITREIAAAIDHAHANGIIHRDIKPQNVVFDDSRALICDFGVARALATAGGERLSSSGVIVGTPEYMSPEQATGILDIGQAADIYALGCLVYTILAGEPPFSGPTTQAVLARHVKAPVPTLNIVRHDVPQAVQRAVERALAKNPQDRPATAGEMVREMSA